MGRTPRPVTAGDAFGLAVAVCDAPGRSAMNTYRCSACGTERRTSVTAIASEIARGATRGCTLCARREGLPPGGTVSHDRRPKSVAAGERFGDMESLRALPSRSAVGTFRCVTCRARKRTTAHNIRQAMAYHPTGRGCARCNRRNRRNRPRGRTRAVAVNAGDTVGPMVALAGAPRRSVKVRWRCTTCLTERALTYCNLVTAHRDGRACLACNPRPKLSAEELRRRERAARIEKQRAFRDRVRASGGGAGKIVTGTKCDHDKELVCVAPAMAGGGAPVEIWRCRVCEPVSVPAWTAPRAGALFPRKALDDHEDEDNPGFENAVRALEEGR